jgi:hypothetical protein
MCVKCVGGLLWASGEEEGYATATTGALVSVLTNPRASPGRVPQVPGRAAHPAENHGPTQPNDPIRRGNCFASCCPRSRTFPCALLAGLVWICLQQSVFMHPEAGSDEQVGQHQHGALQPVAAAILGVGLRGEQTRASKDSSQAAVRQGPPSRTSSSPCMHGGMQHPHTRCNHPTTPTHWRSRPPTHLHNHSSQQHTDEQHQRLKLLEVQVEWLTHHPRQHHTKRHHQHADLRAAACRGADSTVTACACATSLCCCRP